MTQIDASAPPRKVQLEDIPVKTGMTKECVATLTRTSASAARQRNFPRPRLTFPSLPPFPSTGSWPWFLTWRIIRRMSEARLR